MPAQPAWRSIVIGIAVSAGLLGLALAGSIGVFVLQHHDTQVVSAEAANDEFVRARAAFAGRQPLVEIRDGADPVIHRIDGAAPVASGSADTRVLHTMVYESGSRRLVRTTLPLWVVRLMQGDGFTYLGNFTFLEDTEFETDRVGLTLDDLDRLGRGLIVDHRHPGGGQCLVWVD